MLTFCFDRMSNPDVLGYPNLAQENLQPDNFDHVWPRCVPCRLLVYFKRHDLAVRQCLVDDAPVGSWYPVALAWFDFDCDYFSLIPKKTIDRVRKKEIKILFYYHEGDNPFDIDRRIQDLCLKYELLSTSVLFISANSRASNLRNFFYFPDHEFFFNFINRHQQSPIIDGAARPYDFTVLNRTHKWWRATAMSDLWARGILDRSLWSYNTSVDIRDRMLDNPIEIDHEPGWRSNLVEFLSQGPYFCDGSDDKSHNDHRQIPSWLWQRSYFNLVLETHFDADGSGGTFITEKTYKCFKYAQPFVMIGPCGTLAQLRRHGYRVFDSVIDNSYDMIEDNTKRWLAIRNSIQQLASQDLHQCFLQCLPDIQHNQRHFNSGNSQLLNELIDSLT